MVKRHLFLFLLLSFIAFSCSSEDTTPTPQLPEEPSPTQPEVISYLALGDSYTIGESVAEQERYPLQLADSLRQMGFDIMPPEIVAKTGWSTSQLSDGIAEAGIQGGTYGLVSLLIGVNNQFRNQPIEAYPPEFTSLLDLAIEFAGGDTSRVFVLSIPDYAFTPFGNGDPEISQGIDEYNAINRQLSESYGIRYFDITPISREGISQPELVAPDGLHPSGEQYRRWVGLMLEDVKIMLEN